MYLFDTIKFFVGIIINNFTLEHFLFGEINEPFRFENEYRSFFYNPYMEHIGVRLNFALVRFE